MIVAIACAHGITSMKRPVTRSSIVARGHVIEEIEEQRSSWPRTVKEVTRPIAVDIINSSRTYSSLGKRASS
jgi:hypothetical protein